MLPMTKASQGYFGDHSSTEVVRVTEGDRFSGCLMYGAGDQRSHVNSGIVVDVGHSLHWRSFRAYRTRLEAKRAKTSVNQHSTNLGFTFDQSGVRCLDKGTLHTTSEGVVLTFVGFSAGRACFRSA